VDEPDVTGPEPGRRPRRNTRPRDQLGRPLPYGSRGVVAPPEGVVRTPAETLREAQRLLDDGLPFHAHEVLEDAWKTEKADDADASGERELWRGLAQLAVGITHAARGNRQGAAALLRRGAANIAPWAGAEPHGVPVDAVLAWAQRAQHDAALGSVPEPLRLAGT
jgi:uncharacterized protein